MLTLALLRHAKSSWDRPHLDDFDRPLNARGLKAAPAMGGVVREVGLEPDVILCSSSIRTRETWALAGPAAGLVSVPVRYEDDLYLASGRDLLERIRKLPVNVGSALVIGHNPGMHALALDLVHTGDAKSIHAMEEKFPTGALAVFSFAMTRWSDIAFGLGRLEHFITPRERA
jgi:phosphohistidine phosphatase